MPLFNESFPINVRNLKLTLFYSCVVFFKQISPFVFIFSQMPHARNLLIYWNRWCPCQLSHDITVTDK